MTVEEQLELSLPVIVCVGVKLGVDDDVMLSVLDADEVSVGDGVTLDVDVTVVDAVVVGV